MIIESRCHIDVKTMNYDELEDEWNSLQEGLDAADTLLSFCETDIEVQSVEFVRDKLSDRHTEVDEYWAEMEWKREHETDTEKQE